MKARIATFAVMLVATTWTISSCQTNNPKEQPREKQGGEDPDDRRGLRITYDGDIERILDRYCLSCHSGDQAPNLEGYTNARKWAKTSLAAIKDGSMPQSSKKLTSSERRDFEDWVDAGMPERESDTTPPITEPGSSLVTYENWTRDYVRSNCLTCHAQGQTSPDLSSYTKLKSWATAVLREMEDDDMPQGRPATSAQKAKMRDWVNGGMLEYDRNDGGSTGQYVTYANTMRSWIQSYCLSCHSIGQNAPDLSSESKARAEASQMLSSVRSGRMPQGRTLSTSEKAKLEDWVQGGLR